MFELGMHHSANTVAVPANGPRWRGADPFLNLAHEHAPLPAATQCVVCVSHKAADTAGLLEAPPVIAAAFGVSAVQLCLGCRANSGPAPFLS